MITLASDFGTPYPAAMRGVIFRRTEARIVDISHHLPAHDPRAAAFWLRFLLPEYPPAVHCAVVDPGVGTDRDAVVFRADGHAIIAPDNGLAYPTARALALGERASASHVADDGRERDTHALDDIGIEVFRLSTLDPASTTFHGRDVFAPLAAQVHEIGVGALETIDRLEPAPDPVRMTLPDATVSDDTLARGRVITTDEFGNVITNILGKVIPDADHVTVNGERVPFGDTFAAVQPGDQVVVIGSHGYLECDVREGDGSDAFDLTPTDSVTVRF